MSEDTQTIEWGKPNNEDEDKARLHHEALIGRIFNEIFKQYLPASSLATADLHMSTSDIFNKVQEHYPSEVLTPELIYDLMEKAGFTFTTFDNKIEFIWLLKRR